jgi:hypothetical protein
LCGERAFFDTFCSHSLPATFITHFSLCNLSQTWRKILWRRWRQCGPR